MNTAGQRPEQQNNYDGITAILARSETLERHFNMLETLEHHSNTSRER